MDDIAQAWEGKEQGPEVLLAQEHKTTVNGYTEIQTLTPLIPVLCLFLSTRTSAEPLGIYGNELQVFPSGPHFPTHRRKSLSFSIIVGDSAVLHEYVSA